ncbi:hypothetical protein ES708_23116 [subsurface metagenome]
MKEQCEARVSPPGQWGSFQQHQCSKAAVVIRGDKSYCKIHDPEYIKQQDKGRALKRKARGCQKCYTDLKVWWRYCPMCGTKRESQYIIGGVK